MEKIRVETIEFNIDEQLAEEIEFIESAGWVFLCYSLDAKALSVMSKYTCKAIFRKRE